MAGYPPAGSGYPPYGAPPAQPYYGGPAGDQKPHKADKPHKTDPYGAAAPPAHGGAYGGAPPAQPYYGAPAGDQKPHKTDPYGGAASAHGGAYGGAPTAQPYYGAPAGDQKPHKTDPYGGAAQAHGGAYGGAPTAQPYYGAPGGDQKPHKSDPYGGAAPLAQPYYGGGAPADQKPHKSDPYGGGAAPAHGGAYGLAPAYGSSPFAALVPSAFPPGTDPSVVACFQSSDTDRSGFIDDREMQRALSSYNQTFSIRTVHLLMYMFTCSNVRKIGPKEFCSMFYSLQEWRSNFERFDRDRSGRIDTNELRDALMSLGFAVPPVVLDLLVSKFDTSSGGGGGKNKSIEYDNFIECCLTVKGLTEKFKEKDVMYSGSANFTYESFMLTVLPFLIA